MAAEFISAAEAAKALGVSKRRVLALIGAGRLRATRVGQAYVIRARDLDAVRVRKPGKPRKENPEKSPD